MIPKFVVQLMCGFRLKTAMFVLLLANIAQTFSVQAAPIVEINQKDIRLNLSAYVDVFEDKTGQLSFDEIQTNQYHHRFSPTALTELFFGYTESVYWLRFSVENQLADDKKVVLEIRPADIDFIDVYGMNTQLSQEFFHKRSGSAVSMTQRDYRNPLYYFDLAVSAKSSYIFYVRLASNKTINTQLMLSSSREHFFYAGMRDWWQGFLFGMLLCVVCLHLIAAIFLRRKDFIYCGLWLFTIILIQGSWNGYFLQFLPADVESLDKQLAFNVYLSMVFGLLFVRSYLDTHHRSPVAHRVLTFFLMISVMSIPCVWLFSPAINAVLVGITTVPVCFFVFGLAVYGFLEGYEPARYFVWVRAITIIMILIVLSADQGWLANTFVAEYGLIIAFILEGAVFLCVMIWQSIVKENLLDAEVRRTAGVNGQSAIPVSAFCHELRTPISGVMGMTELLLDTDLSHQQRVQMESVYASGNSLLEVVNKMSDIAAIERDDLELNASAFEMMTLIEGCVENARVLSEQRHIELIYQVDEEVSGWMEGDRDKLQQTMSYLLNYSIRHLESGEILLGVKSEGDSDIGFEVVAGKNTFVQEFVSPSSSLLESDRLLQMSSVDNLNLTVAKHFVGLMGGALSLESRVDGGVRLGFTASLARQNQMIEPENIDIVLRGKSLMIIDDNETCCKIIQQQATRWGMEALSAMSGRAALDILQSRAKSNQPIDILLVDYEMPGMNGLEFLAQMERKRSNLNIDNTLVLILTGVSKMPSQLTEKAASIQRVLYKPLSGKNLKLALVEALQQS